MPGQGRGRAVLGSQGGHGPVTMPPDRRRGLTCGRLEMFIKQSLHSYLGMFVPMTSRVGQSSLNSCPFLLNRQRLNEEYIGCARVPTEICRVFRVIGTMGAKRRAPS